MFNPEKPTLEELPSSAQLLCSTIIAFIAALVILVTVVYPAEYAIDPTGAGRVLGLTERGENKVSLAREAKQDKKKHANQSNAFDRILQLFVSSAYAQEAWRDEVSFTLEPGKAMELKLTMAKGATAHYKWAAEGGRMNFDLHAHGKGSQAVTYKKVRGKQGGEGSFTTPFAGDHGWFWRNRDKKRSTIKLQLRGDYSEVKQTAK